MQKVIALSSDYNYISQIETTIKSILFNNLNVKIYVINSDIVLYPLSLLLRKREIMLVEISPLFNCSNGIS